MKKYALTGCSFLAVFLASGLALAADDAEAKIARLTVVALPAGLAIGVAAFGGALGQGKAAAAALEGMARNPNANIFVQLLISLAMIESLVLFSFVIAIMLLVA